MEDDDIKDIADCSLRHFFPFLLFFSITLNDKFKIKRIKIFKSKSKVALALSRGFDERSVLSRKGNEEGLAFS